VPKSGSGAGLDSELADVDTAATADSAEPVSDVDTAATEDSA